MDISEKRVPQDGKIKIGPNRIIDFRVSTLPTLFGEKIVIRILTLVPPRWASMRCEADEGILAAISRFYA
jgi:type II secretory ATPase GspE/PulE/Tfp pilus assembly ATPase PilB-like protein